MRKKGFTIIEILTVVVIMGFILGMVKNFLNTGRQEKLIFGETCVNYLFGEMQRFSDDLKFSKNSVTSLSGSKVVKTTTMMYGNTTVDHSSVPQSIRATFAAGIFDFSGNEAPRYVNFGPSYRSQYGEPPALCKNTKYTLGVQGTLDGNVCRVHTSEGNSISNDCSPGTTITGESIINVCDAVSISALGRGTAKNCLEIAKLIVDKRQDDYFYLKCVKTDPVSGLCSQRPTLN